MKLTLTLLTVFLGMLFLTGTIDLDNLPNYANQSVPNYINRDNTPANNPITDEGATLGRVLFYDTNLSANNKISCASCHQQEFAFGDPAVQSEGFTGALTGRHSMRLVNARFAEEEQFFWDERATSLEDQTTRPIQDHIEMGFSGEEGDPSLDSLVSKLSQIDYYQPLFQAVYGDHTITEERMQLALAQFIRSIQSFDSKYDEGRAMVNNNNANFPNFTAEENLGKRLFTNNVNQNGANCQACHRAPTFDIDDNSRNNGVIGVAGDPTGIDVTNTRAPSLRDLVNPGGVLNGPLMHDGSLSTLLEVINHYDRIPVNPNNNNLDNRLRGGRGGQGQNLQLTQDEKEALVAFLGTLTGSAMYTDEKWSSPFDANGQLTILNGAAIDNDNDGFSVAEDCDDNNAAIHPNAEEILDNDIDENCDGILGETAIVDNDGDGFNAEVDCDDNNATIHPDAEEILDNNIDENCDGIIGETEVVDNDGDGFNAEDDCDDSNAAIHPNAEEILDNEVDENCDGIIGQTAIVDNDGDGFNAEEDCDDNNAAIHPNAEEILDNGIDENCDGVDEVTNNGASCTAPTDISATPARRRRVDINWQPIRGATGYILRVRFTGQDRWVLQTSLRRNSVSLSGPPNNYEYQIQTVCDNEVSEFSPIMNLTIRRNITDLAESRNASDAVTIDILEDWDNTLEVFPNPVSDLLTIQYTPATEATLVLHHISGQLLTKRTLSPEHTLHQIEVATFPDGIYLMTIQEEGRLPIVRRLMKVE